MGAVRTRKGSAMKLGVMIEGQEGVTWELWRKLAEKVDAWGFDSLGRSDHIRTLTGGEHKQLVEAWTVLTYLATATKRLRFGTVVSPMTFRHPAMIALQATAVDELSGGRLWLGLGAGWNDEEHAAFGIALPPLKERMDRFEEGVQVVHALMTTQPASFQGTYYS